MRKHPLFYAFQFFVRYPLKAYKFPLFFHYVLSHANPVISLSILKGKKIVLDLRSHIDRTLFFYGETEKELSSFLQKYLRPNSVFFDVGANSGYFSLLAANTITTGEVHAFEPVPTIYHNFKKSIRFNKIKNISLNECCVGDKNTKVTFYTAIHADVSSMRKTAYHKKSKKTQTRMVTLDKYCQNLKKKVDIMKIDVEGAEKFVLLGAKNMIKRDKPIVIIELSSITTSAFGYNPNELYDFLVMLGYKIYSYQNGSLRKQEKKDYYSEDVYCIMSTAHANTKK